MTKTLQYNSCLQVQILAFSCFIFFQNNCFTQGWIRTYGTSTAEEDGFSIVQAYDGGFVMAGTRATNYSMVMKINSNGSQLLWAKGMSHCYNDVYQVQANKNVWIAKETAGSGYIMAGHDWKSQVSGPPGPEMEMIHFSNTGAFWNKTFGNNYDALWLGGTYYVADRGYCVIPTADGGYIMAGYTEQADATNNEERNVALVKTNAAGTTLQWSRAFGGSTSWDEDEDDVTIDQAASGDYFIAGTYRGIDMFIARVALAGTLSWEKRLSTAGTDLANVVYEATDGGFVIGGQGGTPTQLPVLIHTNNAGGYLWSRKYTVTGGTSTIAYGMTQVADGGYMIVGESTFTGNKDAIMIKTNGAGITQWARRFGDTDADIARDVKETSDGGFIIGGSSNNRVYPIWPTTTPNAISDDFLFIYTNALGVTGTSFESAITVTDADAGFSVSATLTNDVNHVLFASTATTCGSTGANYSNVFTANPDGHPLPIELLILSGKYLNEKVLIEWKTLSEISNDFFTIEKMREDGPKDWKPIGHIDGAGNSNGIRKYHFVDKETPSDGGTAYYRLVQTDYDGKTSTYGPISVTMMPSTDIFIQEYSLSGQVNIFFPENSYNKNAEIKIHDAIGRLQYRKSIKPSESDPEIWIDASYLKPGPYIVSVYSDNRPSVSKKIFKF